MSIIDPWSSSEDHKPEGSHGLSLAALLTGLFAFHYLDFKIQVLDPIFMLWSGWWGPGFGVLFTAIGLRNWYAIVIAESGAVCWNEVWIPHAFAALSFVAWRVADHWHYG